MKQHPILDFLILHFLLRSRNCPCFHIITARREAYTANHRPARIRIRLQPHFAMEAQQAIQYLDSLIGQTLRVNTTDTRLFVGTFKCTDAVGIIRPWTRHMTIRINNNNNKTHGYILELTRILDSWPGPEYHSVKHVRISLPYTIRCERGRFRHE